MIGFDLGKYINYVKSEVDKPIEDYYIEKDYLLSLFLSTWQNLRKIERISALDDLIFKGGTLLMRNHLAYPRISEDLDFTHKRCEELRQMSQNKRVNAIRNLIIPILKDIKTVCDSCGFDFKTDRKESTYVTAYNHKSVYSLSMYRISNITTIPIRIKIEINFIEHLEYSTQIQTINHLVSDNAVLASLGYHLVPLRISCYSLEEIVLEKYRAILTRDNPKQRDIYDLYQINKKKLDVFSIDMKKIQAKVNSGKLASPHFEGNLKKNCNNLLKEGFLESDDDISILSLSPVDPIEYNHFKKKLFKQLKILCKKVQY